MSETAGRVPLLLEASTPEKLLPIWFVSAFIMRLLSVLSNFQRRRIMVKTDCFAVPHNTVLACGCASGTTTMRGKRILLPTVVVACNVSTMFAARDPVTRAGSRGTA
jgi:hypothetical protein